jgi:DMSO/TMAO reductase YedYZ heme-binding membrane subunit
MLGPWWKRIQQLAYVYFYAGALYEMFALQSTVAMVAISLVTVTVFVAWAKKRFESILAPLTA